MDNDEVLRDNEVVAVVNKVIPVTELDELLNVVAELLDDEGEENPGIVSLPGLYFARS